VLTTAKWLLKRHSISAALESTRVHAPNRIKPKIGLTTDKDNVLLKPVFGTLIAFWLFVGCPRNNSEDFGINQQDIFVCCLNLSLAVIYGFLTAIQRTINARTD
jgi:hypothetical protein